MRVLLLGASGLLGSHLAVRLPGSFETVAPASRDGALVSLPGLSVLPVAFDARDERSIATVLDQARPDVVVNAVGITPGAMAREGGDAALEAVNARFPHRLAAAAVARGARVVHVSTDAVFSGRRGGYREDDVPDPADAYGRTKLAGELAAPHLTIRTSLFGRTPRGSGLIEWLVSQRGRSVPGYTDYVFSGVAASVLADLLVEAVARGLEGVYHVGGEPVTKHALLSAASEYLDLGVTVVPARGGAVDRSLDAARFFAAIGRARPTLAEMLPGLRECPGRQAA